MKYIIPFLTLLVTASCSTDSNSANSGSKITENVEAIKKADVTIDLSDLLKEYQIIKNLVKMTKK